MAVDSTSTLAAESAGRKAPLHRSSSVHIDETIHRPGAVKINVAGAFITEESGTNTPLNVDDEAAGVHDTRDIRLPHHTSVVSHVAVDIGGSLAKLVYFSHEPESKELGGRLTFLKFEADRIEYILDFINRLKSEQATFDGGSTGRLVVVATGGGAFKYYDRMKEVLQVEVLREDEMECLIIGLDFFITEIPGEVFSYKEDGPDPIEFEEARADIYPYLLVNIGSGVSMVKVSGPRQYERIGGTSLGGGTLWGILSMLTGARSFDAMLELADKGDNTAVDMMVGDIYGAGYGKIGLKSSVIASSFGKVFRMKRQAEMDAEDGGGLVNGDRAHAGRSGEAESHFAPEDISASLLYAVSNNVGQIAYLLAEKHGLKHIYFGGSFIRGHRQTIATLSHAIKFWSKGDSKAHFLRHEGYLGAVGAFLKRQPRNWGRKNSFEDTTRHRPDLK